MNVKIAMFNEIRDRLDRFSNLPVQREFQIGDIVEYDNRSKSVTLVTSCSSLGVSLPNTRRAFGSDEAVSSRRGVKVQFGADADKSAVAEISFKRANSLHFQTKSVELEEIELAPTLDAIFEAEDKGNNFKWDYEWRLVVRVWHVDALTLGLSNDRDAAFKISASVAKPATAFNIADAELGLSVAMESSLGYRMLAEKATTPFYTLATITRARRFKSGAVVPRKIQYYADSDSRTPAERLYDWLVS